jgi:disease resistance protein RPM1
MLGISNMVAENGRDLCTSLQNMVQLKILVVSSISEEEILDLQSISLPPQFLEHIFLRGWLEKLLDWIARLHNLVTLGLFFSFLMEDPLLYVQTFPNLINFNLHQGYDGEHLHFEEGGFPKLKKLTLRKLNRLKIVEIDKGSLPVLEQLEIGLCPLVAIPPMIKNKEFWF